jgi:hypothetical protein
VMAREGNSCLRMTVSDLQECLEVRCLVCRFESHRKQWRQQGEIRRSRAVEVMRELVKDEETDPVSSVGLDCSAFCVPRPVRQ